MAAPTRAFSGIHKIQHVVVYLGRWSNIPTCMATQTTRLEDPSDDQIATGVDVLKLLADPTRLRILWALLHSEHSVNELADHVGAQPAAVSQHLAKLRLARVVTTRRQGTRIFYATHNAHIRRVVHEVLAVSQDTAHRAGAAAAG